MSRILDYHERTRHFPDRFARAMGWLDWDNQPDPFRRYEGAPRLALPLVPVGSEPPYDAAFFEGHAPPAPLSRASVGQLFQDALGLTAWKEVGGDAARGAPPTARWALRANPSSGNLHPTEGYLVAGPVPGLADDAAVYHYDPHGHALERRAGLPAWDALAARLPPGAILVGLTGIAWRESWKYGERALRYCGLDLGHAVASVAVAAAGLGWAVRWLEGPDDDAVAGLLGVEDQDDVEGEVAEALLVVFPAAGEGPRAWGPEAQVAVALPRPPGPWAGTRARLSEEHHDWPIVEEASDAARRKGPAPAAWWGPPPPPNPAVEPGDCPFALRAIVQQRRSAVAMDGRTGITAAAFFQLLGKCLPGAGQVPFATLPWAPRVHLALLVHRVAGVDPGLYVLVRDLADPDGARARLQAAMTAHPTWSPVPGAPAGLPLFHLATADARAAAQGLMCGQDIASDGVVAVAMLAELGPAVRAFGDWAWRRLHAEAGAIGQVLYLEAEATGVRGTGIGCFFDESIHRLFGVRDDRLRAVYGFTLGGPVEDERLRTVEPYGHLGGR